MKYIDDRTQQPVAVDASTIFFLVKNNTDEFYIKAAQSSRSLLPHSFSDNLYVLKIETAKVPLFRFTKGYDEIFPRDVLRQNALTKKEVRDYLKTDTSDFEYLEARPNVIQEGDYLAFRAMIWEQLPRLEANAKSKSALSLSLRF